jgi:hypothetical protein
MTEPLDIPLPDDEDSVQQQPSRDIKLPVFWPSRPRAWFTYIESRFRLRHISSEQVMFDHVLSALPEDMVGQILDLVEAAPEATPYTFLKARILETHQLSDYEKFDMLVKMEPMGGRKPSQLLAAMMEFCPTGMEKTLPFHYYFTQRLPPALRTQLGEVEHGMATHGLWRPELTSCGLCTHLRVPPWPLSNRRSRRWLPSAALDEEPAIGVVAAPSAAVAPVG